MAPPQRGRAGRRGDWALFGRVRGSAALVPGGRARLRNRWQSGRGPVPALLAQRPELGDALPQDRGGDGGRAIFAGVADRVVPAAEAETLWRHWEEPRIVWYQGTHRDFLGTTEGRTLVTTAVRDA